ncbi:hypothetical protein L9F63_023302, partial [Diploptera punctata]
FLPSGDPDIIYVFPSGVGQNDVGRFLLFSHWRIPIFFRFFPRKSGKMRIRILFRFFLRESGKIFGGSRFR